MQSSKADKTTPILDWQEGSVQGAREENQDFAASIQPDQEALIARKGVLILICDGVGGELGGKRASELAARTALNIYYEDASPNIHVSMVNAITAANEVVRVEAVSTGMTQMATTIVMAVVYDDRLFIAHVGDSRAYLLREGKLIQLTDDHSLVNEHVKNGVLTPTQAKQSVYRNVILRSLGSTPHNTPDVSDRDLLPGDRILLCSDGLHGALEPEEIEQILSEHSEPGKAIDALIQAALDNGSKDNVSASLLNYRVARPVIPLPMDPVKTAAGAVKPMAGLIAAIALIGIGAIAFALIRNAGTSASPTATTTPVSLVTQSSTLAAVIPVTRPRGLTATVVPTPTIIQATPTLEATATLRPTSTSAPSFTAPPTPSPEATATIIPIIPLTAGSDMTVSMAMTPAITSTPVPEIASPEPDPTAPSAADVPVGLQLISAGTGGDEGWGSPKSPDRCNIYDGSKARMFSIDVSVRTTGTYTATFYDEHLNPLPTCFATSGNTALPAAQLHSEASYNLRAFHQSDVQVRRLILSTETDGRLDELCLPIEGQRLVTDVPCGE